MNRSEIVLPSHESRVDDLLRCVPVAVLLISLLGGCGGPSDPTISCGCEYHVKSGDTVSDICLERNIPQEVLFACNNGLAGAPYIDIGQQLAIPCPTATSKP